MKTKKLCIHCEHYKYEVKYKTPHKCLRNIKKVISLVDGEIRTEGAPLDCEKERKKISNHLGMVSSCGAEGKHFKKRKS